MTYHADNQKPLYAISHGEEREEDREEEREVL